MTYVLYALIIAIFVYYYYMQYEHMTYTQSIMTNPKCNHVKKFDYIHKKSDFLSKYSDSFDCYNKCVKNADCNYVGVGFDCYDNCFNKNLSNNTLGDYNQ